MSTNNHLLDIAWLVPGVFRGSGGHANIFRHVAHLSDFGHRNTIYCDNSEGKFRSDAELREFISENFVDTKARVLRNSNLQRCDIAIATHWSTVNPVHEFPNCSKKFYFVQDYEPYFYPVGFDYLRAENNYHLGLSCITLGRWLTHLLKERHKCDADYFDFAVDDATYHAPGVRPNRRIAFYAQPEKPRRCFELGVRALEIVYRLCPRVEIALFGSKSQPTLPITFPHTNLGVISPQKCADLYRSSQVGLILSASNPSLIPVEMMACGCAVVDLDRENNRFDYEAGTISLADSNPEALAQAMIRLLDDENVREAQVGRALEMVSQRSFERSAHKIETLLLKGWITGCVSSTEDLRLDEFQPFAEQDAELDTECVQTFTPSRNNLCEIEVCFANPMVNGANNSIYCEIWDCEENVALVTAKMPVQEIGNRKWHAFSMPVQPSSKDRQYRMILRSNGALGSHPRVLYSSKAVYSRGKLLLSGKHIAGSLKFKTYCAEGIPIRSAHEASIGSELLPRKARWEDRIRFVGSSVSESPAITLRLAAPNLRETVTALTYPKAGILVRSARLLLLIKHYWVWAGVHFRQGGPKAVFGRVRNRLRFILSKRSRIS